MTIFSIAIGLLLLLVSLLIGGGILVTSDANQAFALMIALFPACIGLLLIIPCTFMQFIIRLRSTKTISPRLETTSTRLETILFALGVLVTLICFGLFIVLLS